GLFDFPEGKPDILEKLNVFMNPKEEGKEFAIYFTNQIVMNRLLQLL
ncbi:MAG: hypothetical protein HRT68_06120, partial [Flavobacteriaceae bacterium]|nr:hypothetical protein [Flavobacteriaceae bacterium]